MADSSNRILEVEIPTDETSIERLLDGLASLNYSQISSGTIGPPVEAPPSKYDTVVVGSGFAGTAISLFLADKYNRDGRSRRISILERGQWWVKPKSYKTSSKNTYDPEFTTICEFLNINKVPYSTLEYQSGPIGIIKLLDTSRTVNRIRGLYDLRSLKNIYVFSASGVGGSSLLYPNPVQRPSLEVCVALDRDI